MTSPEPRSPQAGTAPSDPPAPEGGSGRRTVVIALLAALLGAVALVTLGAAADRGEISVFTGQSERQVDWEPEREPYSEPDWSTQSELPQPPERDGVNWGLVTVISVLVAALVVVAVWVLLRMRRLARPALVTADDAADEEELTTDQARAALDDARERLSTVVEAHDAVIAAWLALERAIAAAGVRRWPSQTTLEFVVDVLGSLELDATALDRLAHLYRRALFDDHPLHEGDRDAAIAHLDTLVRGLEDRSVPGTR